MTRVPTPCRAAVMIAVFTAIAAPRLGAQEVQHAGVPRDTTEAAAPDGPTPGGAFARALLIPGWGHAALGSYVRGGVYFGVESASWFMLLKTMAKLGEARNIEARRVELTRESLLAGADSAQLERFLQQPATLAAAVDSTEAVRDSRQLVEAREGQREDWIAWTVFWTLASAIDAYVTAQLSDFPVQVTTEPRQGGGLRLGVSLPTRRWW